MRAVNVAGTWVALSCAFIVMVLNVSWEQPFVERTCEPRPEPLPQLCTTVRALTDDQWRSPVVAALVVVWALAGFAILALRLRGVIGAVGVWRKWRATQASVSGFTYRRAFNLLTFRRRIVLTAFAFLSAVSFSVRRGAYGAITQPAGPDLVPPDLSPVVIQQTVIVDAGMSSWPQVMAWALFVMLLCWWASVAATDHLERRVRQERLWHEAHASPDGSLPGYPDLI